MALTGLQIQKILPRTNCKECGSNTCLAFAMKLAARNAEIAMCPYASDEAKRILGEAYEPPVREISLGSKLEIKTGGETVLYRHEKTFVNQTAFAVNVSDTDSESLVDEKLRAVSEYCLLRVGETLIIDMVAVSQRAKDNNAFLSLVKKSFERTKKPLVLRSPCKKALADAARIVSGSPSVLAPETPEDALALLSAAKEFGHALAIHAPTLDELVELAKKIKDAGMSDVLLCFETPGPSERFQTKSIARRAAIRENFKPLSFSSLHFIESCDLARGTVEAVGEISKYGGICVLPSFDAAQMSSLMTLRLNIFTDPQKPIQVEPKVYAIGEPTPDSPVFVTTNFSLTYFIVSGEIENSGISAWLVIPECEGMSVLTAWAAGKFSGESIAKFCKAANLDAQVRSRDIVIPGHVAQISGELEENLPGWKVIVGPQEAADLESFVKLHFL